MEHVASYTIDGETLIRTVTTKDDGVPARPLTEYQLDLHQEIWNRTREIIPDDYEHYIRRFDIGSDGPEEVMAYVEPNELNGELDYSSWLLSVDIVDTFDHMGVLKGDELDPTLIHEFAHILSINSTQVDPVALEDQDDDRWRTEWDFTYRYRTFDVIFREESYLNRFFQEFWGSDQIQEWFALEETGGTVEEYYLAFNALAVHYHTDFVSDYAMTSPEEDFAESFTYFVMEEMPEGGLRSHRKIRFFYAYPELVLIRDGIRAVLPLE